MNVSANSLIEKLPAYEDNWILINEKQNVKDIISEILEAHEEFSPYYDKIALCFNSDSVEQICNDLFYFCKEHITYKEESEQHQTSALPTGILIRGFGDCKHYAGFCGGILAALNRAGKKIKWCYRFASYEMGNRTPHHVFIVVKDKGGEIWIDPTPGANDKTPVWYVDKKIPNMALTRNISGIPVEYATDYHYNRDLYLYDAVGKSNIEIDAVVNQDNLNHGGAGKYANVWTPYLGLSIYRDYGGDRDITNLSAVTDKINQLIGSGPSPGHAVDSNFVKWIYDSSVRSWNFYYPNGVQPGFNASSLLPVNYPRLVITPDKRLTFDKNAPSGFFLLTQPGAAELHLLNAWGQALINEFDETGYPLKPAHLDVFFKTYGDKLDNPAANLFTEHRGQGLVKQVLHGVEKYLNSVKAGFIKILGSVSRNAFLGMVGINLFNWAKKLFNKIENGGWDELSRKWKMLGGNPDKLLNTIEHGAKKEATTENSPEVLTIAPPEQAPVEAVGVVPVVLAAIIAAAAPIVCALLKMFDKDGKATEIAVAVKDGINTGIFPELKVAIGDKFDFLDQMTGKPIEWEVDDIDNENLGGGNNDMPATTSNILQWFMNNPIPSAGIAAVGTLLIMKKKGQKPNYLIPILVGGGIFFLLNQSAGPSDATNRKLIALGQLLQQTGNAANYQIIRTMSPSEIDVLYEAFIVNAGKPISPQLKFEVDKVMGKYGIVST